MNEETEKTKTGPNLVDVLKHATDERDAAHVRAQTLEIEISMLKRWLAYAEKDIFGLEVERRELKAKLARFDAGVSAERAALAATLKRVEAALVPARRLAEGEDVGRGEASECASEILKILNKADAYLRKWTA